MCHLQDIAFWAMWNFRPIQDRSSLGFRSIISFFRNVKSETNNIQIRHQYFVKLLECRTLSKMICLAHNTSNWLDRNNFQTYWSEHFDKHMMCKYKSKMKTKYFACKKIKLRRKLWDFAPEGLSVSIHIL